MKNKIMSLYKKIYLFIVNLPSNLKMLCQWIPVLWNNWDWDYVFLLEIIHFKMKRMANSIRQNNYLVNSDKKADEIQECCNLIELLLENDFTKEEDIEFEKKYGKLKTKSVPSNDKKNIHHIAFYFTKAKENNTEKEAEQEFHYIQNLRDLREEARWNKLFFLMNKNIRNWWD